MATKTRAPTSYRVEVVRSGSWWAVTIPQIRGAYTQAKRLDHVEAMAREVIALMLDIDETDVGALDIEVEPPSSVVDLLAALRQSERAAEDARRAVAAAQRRAVDELRAAGLPMRDVGRLLGVSHQRVSQILAK